MRILIIEDNPSDYLWIKRHLEKHDSNFCCQQVMSQEDTINALKTEKWDVLISDYNVPGFPFNEILSTLQRLAEDLPVIVVTGSIGEETAVEILKQGVWDFVLKDRLGRLIPAIKRAVTDSRAQRMNQELQNLFRNTIETAPYGILYTDLYHQIILSNPQAENIFGYSSGELIDMQLTELIPERVDSDNILFYNFCIDLLEKDVERFGKKIEVVGLKRDFNKVAIEITISSQMYQGRLIIVLIANDITKRKNQEQELIQLANHDALTGLPNRNLLNDRLKQIVFSASRTKNNFAFLFMDLDRFKIINDALGHEYGDLLLSEVAKRLPNCIRQGDTVARMGGDEFAILLPGVNREDEVVLVANKIISTIESPYKIKDQELSIGVSIGGALYPRDGIDVSEILKHADAAMYRSKETGGNAFRFFTPELDAKVDRHLKIAGDLKLAIARSEFSIHYQPLFNLKTGMLSSAEALIRWQHPHLGMISPAEFIPIAEETHTILAIGEWVIREVFQHQKAWLNLGLNPVCVAINLSTRQFEYADLPKLMAELINHYNIDQTTLAIEFEITESMIMRNPDKAVESLFKLKQMNAKIAIDDFGTGYSSLAYLKRFPIDKVKIDRSFIQDIPHDYDDVAISRAIIALSHELGLEVVAEGVETEEQLAFLKNQDCDFVQGFFTGPPLTLSDFESLLETQQTLDHICSSIE